MSTKISQKRILVHCVHGISCSAAVGAALLVALPLVSAPNGRAPATTLSVAAAPAYVTARSSTADVNWGFRAQLAEWEHGSVG
ncbi:hypothetical protein GGX14DRAFT_580186 [Mycena pura]|uniref:Uncharacterized protein n=1 Tax=Mycena pura TaxID=153505 RepID=A0AAD6ULA0_9AGAR|nr:hypothetical protein GGX14DRAFT_580186 [Mycena pura]